MKNKVAVLRKVPSLQAIDLSVLRRLASVSEARRVSRRAPLWSPGQRASALVVRSGVVRESMDHEGRSLTLGFFGRGAFVGAEIALDQPSIGAVEAYEEAVVLEVPGATLREIVQTNGEFAVAMARHQLDQRMELQTRLAGLVHHSAPSRLAAVILDLGRRFGVRDSRGTIVNLRLTHSELAGLIGATRETVSVSVTRLRKHKILETDGKRIIILDRRSLGRLAIGKDL